MGPVGFLEAAPQRALGGIGPCGAGGTCAALVGRGERGLVAGTLLCTWWVCGISFERINEFMAGAHFQVE